MLAAGALVSRPFTASLPDRLGGRICGMLGSGLAGFGLLGLTAASSFGAASAGAVAIGCGLALLYPSLSLLVAETVAPEQRGVAMGAFTSFVDVGLGAGALAGGVITAVSSTAVAFGASAAGAGLACLLLAVAVPRRTATGGAPLVGDRAPA
jgi:MFS family permease